MENFLSQTNVGSLLGIILLLLLCWYDFSKSSQKPSNVFAYYFVLLIFLAINIYTYLALLEVLANIELREFIFIYSGPGDEPEKFRHRAISPIILAILNFGTGAAKVEIYGKEVAIYSSIRAAFSNILPRDRVVEEGIQELISKMGEETEKLETVIRKIENYAEGLNWDILEKEYSIIEKNNLNIKEQISFLSTINEQIESDTEDREKVYKIAKNTQEKIVELSGNINDSLKHHIERIFRNNIKDQKALAAIIDVVDAVIPMPEYESKDILKKRNPNIFYRVLGISILFAVVLSILFSFDGSDFPDGNRRIVYLFISLFFFNFVISFIHTSAATITGFARSAIYGAMAGFAGHFAWIVVTEYHRIFKSTDAFIFHDWTETIVGVRIGLFCAVAIHLIRHYLGFIAQSIALKYFFTSLFGGLLVVLQYYFISGSEKWILNYLLGFIVTMNSIFVSGVFEIRKEN